MPKRVAQTPGGEQIKEYIGSGPFVFKVDEWKPGDRAVYVKFDKYKPRSEPPSGLAGGKVVKVDRMEWIAMPEQQTAVNALIAGEIQDGDRVEVAVEDGAFALRTSRREVGEATGEKPAAVEV